MFEGTATDHDGLPELRFFVDEDTIGLGKGMNVLRHDTVYPGHPRLPEVPKGTLDPVWLPTVTSLGLVVISRDQRLRHRPAELAAIGDAKARVCVLAGAGSLNTWDLLVHLAKRWSDLESFMTKNPEGHWVYRITKTTSGLDTRCMDRIERR